MAYRWLGTLLVSVACACAVGCDAGTGGVRSGTGGAGTGATGGDAGTGGSGATGGAAGSGGVGGSVGTGGTGGTPRYTCVTSALCATCPTERLCETSDDCAEGGGCIESGCATEEGASIKQCAYAMSGACNTELDCSSGSQCIDVPGEGKRCVRTDPGCSAESHCYEGFDCEAGTCADRRVGCAFDSDCPMNHVCETAENDGKQCVRVHQPCNEEFDCAGIAPRCADVDGDGQTECAGTPDPNVPSAACLNSDCTSADAPVCEISGIGAATVCGDYGLCRADDDCDTAEGFICVELGLNGRKECVLAGGTCESSSDCPPNEICGAPRSGGAPSCHGGVTE